MGSTGKLNLIEFVGCERVRKREKNRFIEATCNTSQSDRNRKVPPVEELLFMRRYTNRTKQNCECVEILVSCVNQ